GEPFRVLAVRLTGASGAKYNVELGLERTFEKSLLDRYRTRALILLGIGLIACTAIGYVLARRGLRPLSQMSDAVARIGSATLDQRLQLQDLPEELYALGESFNALLGRLENSFRQLTQFSADIAHELRNPINNLRGETEVALSRARSADE